MDILLGILVVVLAWIVFKNLVAVLLVLLCVGVAVYLIRRSRASGRL